MNNKHFLPETKTTTLFILPLYQQKHKATSIFYIPSRCSFLPRYLHSKVRYLIWYEPLPPVVYFHLPFTVNSSYLPRASSRQTLQCVGVQSYPTPLIEPSQSLLPRISPPPVEITAQVPTGSGDTVIKYHYSKYARLRQKV